jgi:hypothetical protein
MATTEALDIDLLDPSLYRNGMPHKLYAELRERGPVLWHPPTHVQVLIGALLRRFDLIEITDEPKWMSAGPAAAVGVAVRTLPLRLG